MNIVGGNMNREKFAKIVKKVKKGGADIVALHELLLHLSEDDRKKIINWSSVTGVTSRYTKTRIIALPLHGICLKLRQPADSFEYDNVQGDQMISMDSSVYPLQKEILESNDVRETIEFQKEAGQLMQRWETILCPACKGKGHISTSKGQLTTISDCKHCNEEGKIRQISKEDVPKFFEELLGIRTYIV